MHEVSIAESILQKIAAKLERTSNTCSVTNVHIIVGEFRNVDIDALTFAFDNLKSLYAGCTNCKLEASLTRTRAYCRGGNHLYNPEFNNAFCCTECGAGIGKLMAGEELDIVDIALAASALEEEQYARIG